MSGLLKHKRTATAALGAAVLFVCSCIVVPARQWSAGGGIVKPHYRDGLQWRAVWDIPARAGVESEPWPLSWHVAWHVLFIEQAAIVLVGGALSVWARRRDRHRNAAAVASRMG